MAMSNRRLSGHSRVRPQMLAEAAIVAEREAGSLDIQPFSAVQLKAASYVLRLGRRFRRWSAGVVPVRLWSSDAGAEALMPTQESDTLLIEPGGFVLGCTLERIRLSAALAAQISPLSHVARFGLGVNCGADFVNPGYGGVTPSPLTLELYNHNVRPLELKAGAPIAHLRFVRLSGLTERTAPPSIYEGADPLSAPLLYEEWRDRLEGSP